MKDVIIDTSTLLTAARWGIDIEQSLREELSEKVTIYYIDKTLIELEKKPEEKIVLALLKTMNAKKITTDRSKNVDQHLIDYATAHEGVFVATQDKALKEKLKKRRVGIITIRQRKYLKRVN